VGLAVTALSRGIQLVVIPLSIRMLGVEQYGLWLVVGSLVAWGGLTDFGLAPGLVNVVATAHGRDDRDSIRRAISTALAAYGALAVVVAALAVGLSQSSGLPGLLGARGPGSAESVRMLVLVCGLIFAASTLTRVVSTTASALQEGYLGAYWQVAGSVASMGLLFALLGRGGGLLSYALVVSVPPLFVQAGLAAYLFGWRHRDLRPAWGCCEMASLKTLWGFAGPLTLLQLSTTAGLYSVNLLIGNRLGAARVPGYAVPYALFAALSGLIWTIVYPFLPAFAEAAGRSDWDWVRKRITHVFGIGVGIATGGGVVLVLGGNMFLRLWTGGRIQPGMELLLALFACTIIGVSSAINSVILQGIGDVRLLARVYCCMALLVVVGTWLLLPAVGIVASPLASAIGAALNVALTLPRALSRVRAAASGPDLHLDVK
jgi:O-antigen/teichoic acid export membrane protein